MTTYTLAAASGEETGTLVCMCGALPRFSLSLLPPPTHTYIYINTHDHPLRPQEKHCPVIIRHFCMPEHMYKPTMCIFVYFGLSYCWLLNGTFLLPPLTAGWEINVAGKAGVIFSFNHLSHTQNILILLQSLFFLKLTTPDKNPTTLG